jgi:hypothetical protein
MDLAVLGVERPMLETVLLPIMMIKPLLKTIADIRPKA